jgi:tripartite-type tricarboxylate transporter receptor subunit TctC
MNAARFTVLLLSAGWLTGCVQSATDTTRSYPQRPIKVIVPFAAGGGSDTFARLLQRAADKQDLLPVPLVIVNVPGAGGTIGSRRVKNARPDGYTLLLLHDGILTAKYSGQASYGPEAFEPVAGTGDVGLVIAVAEESGDQSLDALMEAARERPDEIRFSANLGAPVHFTGLMLESAAGGETKARFRFIQHGGGAKRLAALLGGHADVSAFSVAEYLQYRDGGIRALAYCGEERHPAVDAPTATEQGFDVVSRNMQFWWAPKGTTPDRIEYVAGVLEKLMASEEVRQQLSEQQIAPVFLTGEELQDEIKRRSGRIASVSQRPSLPLPNFPLTALLAVAVSGVFVIATSVVSKGNSPAAISPEKRPGFANQSLTVALTVAVTAAYVLSLQSGWLDFRPVTFAFVFLAGWVIAGHLRKCWLSLLATAFVMSVGLHFVFTRIFIIDLP